MPFTRVMQALHWYDTRFALWTAHTTLLLPWALVILYSAMLDLSPETIFFAPPQAAVHFAARAVPQKGPEFVLRGIVTYAFNEGGKVTQMRAYWSL